MKTLKSSFKSINTDEIKTFLKNQSVVKANNKQYNLL